MTTATTTNVMSTTTPVLSIREGRPVIEVRDHNLWAHDARTAHFYTELGHDVVSHIYDGTCEDFWQHYAPAVAQEHGFGDVISYGHSAGWLGITSATWWLDYVTDYRWTVPPASSTADNDTRAEYTEMRTQRDRFVAFAHDIAALVVAMEDVFVERLTEELDELEERREASIVRSEN